jgi:endonuclease YncB( thermonuclease family)
MRLAALSVALVLLTAAPATALAEPIVGAASVVDGDTIEIHGQRIRLNGIDAPESRQLCLDAGGAQYRCGQAAAFALDEILKLARPTTCHEVDRDRHGRVVAQCTAGGQDVADAMVRAGHALDWPRYSKGAYASAQAVAIAARRGMWAGSFARPWEWRKGRQTAPLVNASALFD